MKGSRRYLLAAAILAAAGILAVAVGRAFAPADQPKAEQPMIKAAADTAEATPEQLKQIRVEPVRERELAMNLDTTGKVTFNEDRLTPVIPPYSGRVLEVLANKGDLVKSGQPLLVIESPDLVSAINDMNAARSDVDRTKIAVDIAEKSAQRARTLNAQEALATKELQAAESELARAREDHRRAQSTVSIVRHRLALLGKNTDEIAQVEESMTDQVDRKLVIRAPLAGTIVDRKVGPGQYIKPDMPDPLYLISDLSTLWVTVDVYENYLSQIHIGAPVEISVAAYPERKFPARIAAVNPTVDAATRTVHVRCVVANPNGLLKPEMFANIRVGEAVKRKVAMVPSSAILTAGENSFVLIEESTGRFRRRQVKTGREIGADTIVENGLQPSDRVVTTGVLLLNNGLEAGKP